MPPPPIGYPPGHANHADADRCANAAALRVLDGIPIRRITMRVLGLYLRTIMPRVVGDVQPVRDDATQQPAEPDDRRRPMAFPAVPEARHGFHRLLNQRQGELGLQLLVDWIPTWEPASNLDRAHVAEYQKLMRNWRRNERSQ
ncbi:hypothetical protein PR003_g31750 [Phytophthora rubi]|uniref:Uncharacterized protein n=2 Tax=Phytophthora rubi TaxID=129364 RepID=A0A6A4B749_9STRA|nr:hypothetical protein PR003_g31750 [Phytophthora rubi]